MTSDIEYVLYKDDFLYKKRVYLPTIQIFFCVNVSHKKNNLRRKGSGKGRVGRTKNLFPYLDNNCKDRIHEHKDFGILESTKVWNLQQQKLLRCMVLASGSSQLSAQEQAPGPTPSFVQVAVFLGGFPGSFWKGGWTTTLCSEHEALCSD